MPPRRGVNLQQWWLEVAGHRSVSVHVGSHFGSRLLPWSKIPGHCFEQVGTEDLIAGWPRVRTADHKRAAGPAA
jgi:hypothetical protein